MIITEAQKKNGKKTEIEKKRYNKKKREKE